MGGRPRMAASGPRITNASGLLLREPVSTLLTRMGEDVSNMTREQWRQIKTIAIEAWARPAPDRSLYVTEACGADAALLREVESLIASMGAVGDRCAKPRLEAPRRGSGIRT